MLGLDSSVHVPGIRLASTATKLPEREPWAPAAPDAYLDRRQWPEVRQFAGFGRAWRVASAPGPSSLRKSGRVAAFTGALECLRLGRSRFLRRTAAKHELVRI